MSEIICPVPKEQRPLNEFNSISNSWIISWPLLEKDQFYRKLLISWLLIIPLALIISSGSSYLKNNIFYFISSSLTESLIFPFLLLLRQWLSWRYIFKRLNSENIEYEESGWYDGQIWQKPIDWRAKDLLIAQHQVKPILNNINKLLLFLLLIIFSGSTFVLLSINL